MWLNYIDVSKYNTESFLLMLVEVVRITCNFGSKNNKNYMKLSKFTFPYPYHYYLKSTRGDHGFIILANNITLIFLNYAFLQPNCSDYIYMYIYIYILYIYIFAHVYKYIYMAFFEHRKRACMENYIFVLLRCSR